MSELIPEDPKATVPQKTASNNIKKPYWTTIQWEHIKRKAMKLTKTNLTNFFLTLFTLALAIIAYFQYCQYKLANKIALDNFNRANAATMNMEWTFVWRHAYRDTGYYGRRRIGLQFNLWNYSENIVEVKYFKYKVLFNYDESVMTNAFSKNFTLDSSVNIQNKQGYYLNKGGYIKLVIPAENISVQDSINLEKNLNMVFIEVHYYNIKTKENFKYQFKGVINGENKKDSLGQYLEKRQEWESIRGSNPDIPDD